MSEWWSCEGYRGVVSRRRVLAAGTGLASWAFASPALSQVAFRPSTERGSGNTLVVIFLRGGADGLSLVPPCLDDDYRKARPTLAIAAPGDRTAAVEDRAIDIDGTFGLHPALGDLRPLLESGVLGVIHAVGSNDETRSHFEAMNAMERGLAKQREGETSGWLARHLMSAPKNPASPLRAVAIGATMPDSLRGAPGAIALQSLTDFRLSGDPARAGNLERHLGPLYAGSKDEISAAGQETLRVLKSLREFQESPSSTSMVSYPDSDLGTALRQVALLVKSEMGVEVAALDKGGWDTHVVQGRGTGLLASHLRDLGSSLAAFMRDLGPFTKRVTVVVQSEFGRRTYENAGLGTDHGHGGAMLVLGGGVVGGKVHGRWPGLREEELVGPGDLAATTDYRNVLAEILRKRLGNSKVTEIFPGLEPMELGILA